MPSLNDLIFAKYLFATMAVLAISLGSLGLMPEEIAGSMFIGGLLIGGSLMVIVSTLESLQDHR